MSKVMPLQQALKFLLVRISVPVALLDGGSPSDRLVTNPFAGLRRRGTATFRYYRASL